MKSTSLTLLVITSFILLFICCTQSNPDGFLTINCGASTNRTDDEGILWISDIPFTRSRNASFMNDSPTFYLPYKTFAYFTNLTANKYCYLIPVKPTTLYLVRATFYNGAFETGIPLAGVFDIFVNGVKWTVVNLTDLQGNALLGREIILVAKSNSLSLCLARNSQTEKTNYVFISTIELRPLKRSLYNSTDFHNNALVMLSRKVFGSGNYIRYPQDEFDRIWVSFSSSTFDNINIEDENFGKGLANQPPVAVLQSAFTTQEEGVDPVLTLMPKSVHRG
ncbi:hypothetical protein SUGI_0234570 [Cryptomeria japonica]|nr:hypothetical protein SUGI_0234570 [Cryptomeria japonica]